MLAPPSVRIHSDPLPLGAVPQVVEGAPAAEVMVVEPIVITGLPLPATDKCGFEAFDPGGVPPPELPSKSVKVNPGPAPLAINPWFTPPTVR